jgi:hypothetical protein
MQNAINIYNRVIRDLYALILYPIWLFFPKIGAPDNHIYKRKRIKSIALQYQCLSLIETGTYYGQMVNFCRKIFRHVKSAEIYEPLYLLNVEQFRADTKVEIYFGSSPKVLPEMIHNSEGRILFWLDGHYSGEGTGGGDDLAPIAKELNIISQLARNDHCILIDDARCFKGNEEYPTLDDIFIQLRKINGNYLLSVDRDCIMALPVK